MVATIHVLGATPAGTTGDGSYYIRLASSEYYTKGGEPPGRWFGAGAYALGLDGTVESEPLKNLLAGLTPDGAQLLSARRKPRRSRSVDLTAAGGKTRVPGYDICFSAPKSVSAAWASSAPQTRKAIELAMQAAVNQTFDWLAANVPLTRRGRGGRQRQFADLVIAQFEHGTSRVTANGVWEPQLHRHCIIANVARGEDGRWCSVDSRALHDWTRTLGPMFRVNLARELSERLNVPLSPTASDAGKSAGWFEISSVPNKLCERWSSRREEIEELLEVLPGANSAADAHARAAANLLTRRAKPYVPPREQLFAQWESVAQEHGFTGVVQADQTRRQQVDPEQAFQRAWQSAAPILEAEQASFTYRKALQHVLEAAQTAGVAGEWLADRLKHHLLRSAEIQPLGIVGAEEQFATRATWDAEQKLLKTFEELRAREGAVVKADKVEAILARHPTLLAEQRTAAAELLQGGSAIRVLTGVAGAGKSTTLRAVRDAFEIAGYQVHGGAIAAIAKEELEEKANIPSRTIASHLWRLDRGGEGESAASSAAPAHGSSFGSTNDRSHRSELELNGKSVLVLDEAGMIDARTMLRIAEAVVRVGATLVLVGDTAQLQPILAGGPLLHLTRNQKTSELTANLRQTDAEDRAAVGQLRAGKAAEALQNFYDRGRVTIAESRIEALVQLITAWRDAGGAAEPTKHVIFTATRAEARAANRLAQRERLILGLADAFDYVKHGQERIHRGDRILICKNVYADGVRNGYRGEVTGVDRFLGRITIRLDGRDNREVTLRLQDYGEGGLALGYAQTTHKGQGQTVDHAYLLVGGAMTDREMGYVQASRARHTTQFFVDRAHAGEDLAALARAFAKSRVKELAHDVAAEAARRREAALRIERGL